MLSVSIIALMMVAVSTSEAPVSVYEIEGAMSHKAANFVLAARTT
jgi:hypothetical protein